MARFRPIHFGHIVLGIFGALTLSTAVIQPSLTAEPAGAGEESRATKYLPRMNRSAKIDCLTPDGRLVAVPSVGEKKSSAVGLIIDDDTLSCPLQEGETTFIISFPKTSPLERFTFVNENTEAKGEMKIAISNFQLPADSPKWIEVSGKTAFTHKRRFNLSMVGVEARYVKLSFHVEKGGHLASLSVFGGVSLKMRGEPCQDRIVPVVNMLATDRFEAKPKINWTNL
jgi:hypothetical protein